MQNVSKKSLILANEVLYDLDYYLSDHIKPQHKEYNGWWNYDTWKFNLNLTNEYNFIKPLEEEINNISLKDFVRYCLTNLFYFVDEINFKQVNFEEVYTALKDDY